MDLTIGLVRSLLPACVHVDVRVPRTHPSAEILGTERMGSGVVVDGGGLVVTANYVVMGARRLRVTFADGRRVPAEIVAQDFESGLAVLRARVDDVTVATLGTSETLERGSGVFTVAAVGSRERRVAGGIVTDLGEFDAYWEYLLDRSIVSTVTNPGFGGGPLFSTLGVVVGVVSLNLSEIGRQSLAIPIEYYRHHQAELLRFGRVVSRPRRAWIGVFPHAVEEGLVVAGLVPLGPAERSGLQEGDVILRVDEAEVENRRALYSALWRRRPGERVVLEVWRDNGVRRVEVVGEDRAEFFGPEAPRTRGDSPGDDPRTSG